MSRFWTETIKRLTPYVPGEQRAGADIVKLNTNENPYPPSPEVMAAIQAVSGDGLRRYPDPESAALRTALAEYHGLSREQIFVGNGSDEVLALAFQAYFTNQRALQFPELSYSFYPVYCELYSIEPCTVALNEDYSLSLDAFVPNAGCIVFPNPNAPTSRAVSKSAIEALLAEHTEHVLLVDEAYADFGADSAVDLIDHYPNLLVSQTFSKGRSLAGMRLGVALGHPDLIEGLRRVKDSFNSYPVDVLAQAAGIASLRDHAYYRATIERIIATRGTTVSNLQKRGFQVLPSCANFVFARAPAGEASLLFHKLSQAGVLVRYWNKPDLDQWLRISIGTDEDMHRLMLAIDA